jgi:hypothetical protein
MSTLKVNNLESYTPGNPLNVNDELQMTGSTASGNKSVAFGFQNQTSGSYSNVLGGWLNETSGSRSSILGGQQNITDGDRSTVVGGIYNKSRGTETVIVGGASNDISSSFTQNSVILGGSTNSILSGSSSTIIGGRQNRIHSGSQYSTAAGNANQIEANYGWTHGYLNRVRGEYGSAHGDTCEISESAIYGFALGDHIQLSRPYQVGIGKYNEIGNQNEGSVFVIGNGAFPNRRNLADFRSGSVGFVFDTGSIPTSDPGVIGALYRTGSLRDEIKISLG